MNIDAITNATITNTTINMNANMNTKINKKCKANKSQYMHMYMYVYTYIYIYMYTLYQVYDALTIHGSMSMLHALYVHKIPGNSCSVGSCRISAVSCTKVASAARSSLGGLGAGLKVLREHIDIGIYIYLDIDVDVDAHRCEILDIRQ